MGPHRDQLRVILRVALCYGVIIAFLNVNEYSCLVHCRVLECIKSEIESKICNQGVRGSSPCGGTINHLKSLYFLEILP